MIKKQPGRSSSEVLLSIAQNKSLKGNLTYRKLLQELGKRSFGIAILIFVLPIALPFSVIPGISFVFSLPIVFFAGQMMLGAKSLWLPKFIADKEISHEKLSIVIHKTLPYLKKIERLLKPRLWFMTTRIAEIISSLIIIIVSLMLMLPVPFSNFILAFFIVIMALGMAEKDGLLLLIAYIAIFVFIAFYVLFIVAGVKILF